MALTAVQGTNVVASFNLAAAKSANGATPLASSLAKQIQLAFALGTTGSGAMNEGTCIVSSITASGSNSIDLTSVTGLVGTAAVALARAKAIFVYVMTTADTILGVTGTAASGVTIDNTVSNALSAQSHSGWFDATGEGGGTTGSKLTIPNGGVLLFALPTGSGVVVDSSHKIIKLTNLDGSLTAQVLLVVFGADA